MIYVKQISDEDLRKLRWWLRHYKGAGKDFIRLVENMLEGDEGAKVMLIAHLPAYKDTFFGPLYGDVEDVQ